MVSHIMTIYFQNSIFKYGGETSFSLINPPKNIQKIPDYYKFINSISHIYGSTKSDGTIPVFYTKIVPTTTQRQPDPNSTLTTLDPDQTYYIVLISEENLPLNIPYNITSEEFLLSKDQNCNSNPTCDNDTSCYSKPEIPSKNYREILLTNEYTYDIDLTVTSLSPSQKYLYEIQPVYSNWPAKLSSLSGYIKESSSELDHLGHTSGIIKSLFSYYPSGTDYSNSIPYDTNIDTDSNFYFKNLFSILNLSIYSENMDLLFSDNLNIKCNNCLPNKNRKPPTFKFSDKENDFAEPTGVLCTGCMPLYVNYSGLDPSKIYSLSFMSFASNWPSRILPKIDNITPESLYEDPDSNMIYGKGSMVANFALSPVKNPFGSWPNLPYALESFHKEKFIDKNIYNILSLSIYESFDKIFTQSIFIQGDIQSNNEDCIDSLYVQFDNTSNTYPSGGLTEINRPGSEINLSDKLCCNKDQILTATISGACCGKQYYYRFYSSNEYVSLSPLSGTMSFGDGIGKIATIYNLNNRPGTTVRLVVLDTTNNIYAVDNIILRCPNKIPTLPT